MSLNDQPREQIEHYKKLLKAVGSLSKLFSEAQEPYLSSRATENLFCKAFKAENLSRHDATPDASKNKIGYAIKTFVDGNGKSMQKIAEFNGDHSLFRDLEPKKKIEKIAELRNERVKTHKAIFGLDNIIYHCIVRQKDKIVVYEKPLNLIDIKKIKNIKVVKRGGAIHFSDPHAEYSFSVSKSTLCMRFKTEDVLVDFPVKVLEDPFSKIENLIEEIGLIFSPVKVQPHVFLPLYSSQGGVHVPEKSGLNLWNSRGRKRNENEIEIRIPAWIHKKFPKFFPERKKPFELMLSNKEVVGASVCQDGAKALMSNKNKLLGRWVLRDVLGLQEGHLLTYDKLQTIGIDSVVVYKIDSHHYDIDFARMGSYEKFLKENGQNSNEDLITEDE